MGLPSGGESQLIAIKLFLKSARAIPHFVVGDRGRLNTFEASTAFFLFQRYSECKALKHFVYALALRADVVLKALTDKKVALFNYQHTHF
jgi:hypothetical protein